MGPNEARSQGITHDENKFPRLVIDEYGNNLKYIFRIGDRCLPSKLRSPHSLPCSSIESYPWGMLRACGRAKHEKPTKCGVFCACFPILDAWIALIPYLSCIMAASRRRGKLVLFLLNGIGDHLVAIRFGQTLGPANP